MKSALAFRFTVDRFLVKERVFLWTFTYKRALNVDRAKKLWSSANHRFRKSGLLKGVRTFEMHRKHGLHIHMVTETWTPVRKIRALWTGAATDYEGGRIHVEQVPAERAGYIGKYLSKARPPCLKGARLWAAVGGFESSKVRDIVRDCRLTRAYAQCRLQFADFESIPFHRRMAFVRCVSRNTLLRELGLDPEPLPVAV